MATTLNGRRVAILAADGVERVELEQPRRALDDAGARTDVVSIKSGEILARNHDLEDAEQRQTDYVMLATSSRPATTPPRWPACSPETRRSSTVPVRSG